MINTRTIKAIRFLPLKILLFFTFLPNSFAADEDCQNICQYGNTIDTITNVNAEPYSGNATQVADKQINSNISTNKNNPPKSAEEKRWGVLFYTGATSTQQLGQLIRGEFNSASETLYTGEVAYTLKKDNLLRRLFQPLISTMQVAGNVTYRNEHRDVQNIWEYDAYLIFRWQNFPWKNYIDTSLAASEGISYDSHVPEVENDGTTSDKSQRLLNYLMFEAAFALPSQPNIQLAVRIQHRSNAYGVFGTGNSGSNNVGLGLRYLF